MMRASLLALVLLAPALSPVSVLAQDKRPLSAELMWELKRLGPPALSPDGRHVAIAVATNDRKKDQPSSRLWLHDRRDGSWRPLTSEGVNSSNPVWSPDSRRLAFESRRGEDEANQLYVLTLDGGEAQRLTRVPTGVSAVRWFPDGHSLAFISRVWADLDGWEAQGQRLKERKESKVTGRAWDRAPVRWWDRWTDDRETHLFRVPAGGGDAQAITLGRGVRLPDQDPGLGHYDISPDGREIALVMNTDESGVRPNPDLFILPVDGGEPRNLTADNPAPDVGPRYSPDGRWLAYSKQSIPGFYADRAVLHAVDRRSGSDRAVTGDFDRSIVNPVWMNDGRSVVVSVDDAGTNRLYRIAVPDGKVSAITAATSFTAPVLSSDGRVLVALNESFVQPPTLVSVDLRDGRADKLSDFNDELLATIDFGTYESVTYPGADGAPIQMWINYPPGFDRSKPHPLFFLLHGGPHNGITDSFSWRWNAQVFSGWGYVTAWHNFHGSSGFGQAFADSITADWASRPYADTIKAAEWLAAQPYIDTKNMAAGGASYGGYLASLLLGREHPFKTIIAHAAVYNLYGQYAADFGAGKNRHGEFWEDRLRFEATSPHYAAGNFETPTLVIHGEIDYRVPINHGVELFNTLQNRGVRSRFVHYPDENHWILKHNNSIHWYGEVRTWLAEFIGTHESTPSK